MADGGAPDPGLRTEPGLRLALNALAAACPHDLPVARARCHRTLRLPCGPTLSSGSSNATVPLATRTLAAFDGTADFDGASGVQRTGLTADFSNTETHFGADH